MAAITSIATNSGCSLELTPVSDHVWATTDSADPGATLIRRPGRQDEIWTLIDHGRDLARTAELMYLASKEGRDARTLIMLAGVEGVGGALSRVEITDWVPQRVSVLTPVQLDRGGTALPHVPRARAYRVADEQAVIWSPADDVMLAGDLLAPDLPELSRINPHRALEGLQYAVSHAPLVTIGSYGNIISSRVQVMGRAQIETQQLDTVIDLRRRLSYVRGIISVARTGARQGLTPRAAAVVGQEKGLLSQWSCENSERQARLKQRHLVNMHSAMAAEHGRPVVPSEVQADIGSVITEPFSS